MDAFVKAAREHFKDDKIGTKELFELMKAGKLLSKDILPLVGKHMSAAARKGGALEKMLDGNMVAMNRMKQSFQSFQNDIFQGGFGQALTKWFNMIAFGFGTSSKAGKNFGAALGAVMDQLLDKMTIIHDYSLYLWFEFKHYILDNIPDGIKSIIAETAAWAVSIGIIYKAFSTLFKILGMIAGLGGLGRILGVAAFMAKLNPIIRGILIVYGLITMLQKMLNDSKPIAPPSVNVGGGSGVGTNSVRETSNWANGASTSYGYRPSVQTAPNAPKPSIPATVARPAASAPQQPAQLNIKLDEGALKGVISVEIEDNNNKMINSIVGG